MDNLASLLAKDLLDIGAVFLRPEQPFTWASGIISPIYCDNRITLSHPQVRTRIRQGLADIITGEYPGCQLVAGTATAGIAHAALVADRLGLPMCYVRASAKQHGRAGQIEGSAETGQNVVVVEDLISTGGSVVDVVNVLRGAGCRVLGIVSIFTYGLDVGIKKLEEAGVKNTSLCSYGTLVQVALQQGAIKPQQLAGLQAFRQNPHSTAWMQA